MSLRDKAISGASWSLVGRLLQQLSQFIIGIILARLLLPEEYGLVAMATVFIYISFVFVDSGFSSALIQREKCSQADYSTIFYINLLISFFVFSILYLLAPAIARFYNETELVKIIRVLSFLIILFSLSVVQKAKITRNINFKLRTKIEFSSQVASGIIAVFLAIKGYGVWALVWKTLLNQFFVTLQLWIRNRWFPSFEFNKKSLKEMFGFSSRLLISGILDRVYQQIYKLIIGKFFPARELGLYTRADQFQKLPSQSISGAITSFTFPIFSKMQNEPERLGRALKKILSLVMFFNVNAMVLMAVIAQPLISSLLGSKWIASVGYLQLLCFVGILYPIHLINVQILSSTGRSDLFLKIEILKKIFSIPAILLAIFVSIKAMIIGMFLASLTSVYINTYYTNKLIKISLREQIMVILPSFKVAAVMGVCTYSIGWILQQYLGSLPILIIQLSSGVFITILFAHLLRIKAYFELKEILKEKIKLKK